MEQFIVKHPDKITGMISCFDRMVFKGYLPISEATIHSFGNDRQIAVQHSTVESGDDEIVLRMPQVGLWNVVVI